MGAEGNGIDQAQQTPETSDTIDALLEAARYNDVEDLENLVTTGVSLDCKDWQGRTALHMASANGHVGVVHYLIRHGVDVNASNLEQNTALHWACLNGHVEVVKTLILAGANVSALNSHEKTPVDEAVGRGKMDVLDAINETLAQLEISGTDIS